MIMSDPEGLHARNGMRVVMASRAFHAKVTLSCKGNQADAENILEVLGLNASFGDRIEIVADGKEEETAIEAIKKALSFSIP